MRRMYTTTADAQLSMTREILARAFDPDKWVCRIKYRSADNVVTDRMISPLSFGRQQTAVCAFCLQREEPRMFRLDRIMDIQLVAAHEAMVSSQVDQ